MTRSKRWTESRTYHRINAVLDLLNLASLAVAASAAITQQPAALLLGTSCFEHQGPQQHPDSETPLAVVLRPQWPAIVRFPNFLAGELGDFAAAAIAAASLSRTIVNFPDLKTAEPKPVPTRVEGTGRSSVPEEDLEVVPVQNLEEVPEVDLAEVAVTEGPNPEEVAIHRRLGHLNEDWNSAENAAAKVVRQPVAVMAAVAAV